jgi:hypothetical protein
VAPPLKDTQYRLMLACAIQSAGTAPASFRGTHCKPPQGVDDVFLNLSEEFRDVIADAVSALLHVTSVYWLQAAPCLSTI